METTERTAKAEAIAAEIRKLAIEPSAKVWEKNGNVRVYVDGGSRCSTKYGYVVIAEDGTADASNTRGCIKNCIADICEEANKHAAEPETETTETETAETTETETAETTETETAETTEETEETEWLKSYGPVKTMKELEAEMNKFIKMMARTAYALIKNINLDNGNPDAWLGAENLMDEEVDQCLEAIRQINRQANTSADADGRIAKAAYDAEGAETDREYVRLWVKSYGELVIG